VSDLIIPDGISQNIPLWDIHRETRNKNFIH